MLLTSSRMLALMASLFCLTSLVMPWARLTVVADTPDGSANRSTFELVGYRLGTASPADGSTLAHPWFSWWLVIITVAVVVVTFVTSFKPGWRWSIATLVVASIALFSSWPPISGLENTITGGSSLSTVRQTLFGCGIWRLSLLVVLVSTMIGGYFTGGRTR